MEAHKVGALRRRRRDHRDAAAAAAYSSNAAVTARVRRRRWLDWEPCSRRGAQAPPPLRSRSRRGGRPRTSTPAASSTSLVPSAGEQR
uniref:Uncharacterized protein n=1 Tax=Oryza meridionalis TaxID=40149 RepID=A0A0E0F6X4_9ORYZ